MNLNDKSKTNISDKLYKSDDFVLKKRSQN